MKDKDIKKEYKDGELNKFKRRIKRLESENKRLKSELNAYEQAFKKTTKFLKDHTDDISLEELIKAAKEDKSLRDVEEENAAKKACPKCLSELKIIKYPIGTLISCTKCDYRSMEKDSET